MSRMIKTSDGWKKTSGNVDSSELDELKQKLSKLEWTKIATTNGATVVDLSQYNFKELLVVASANNGGANATYSVNIMKECLSSSIINRIYNGFGWITERNILHIEIQPNQVSKVAEFIVSNNDYSSSCVANWYIK